MARELPGPLEKSEMLYGGKISEARAEAIGKAYAAERRWSEAADFYDRAGDENALKELADIAEREGNLFLLARVARALGEDFEPDAWRALAQNALAKGQTAYAAEAYRRAGDEDKADELEGVEPGE